MLPRLIVLAATAFAVTAALACTKSESCTLMGCEDGVSVDGFPTLSADLAARSRMHVCSDTTCGDYVPVVENGQIRYDGPPTLARVNCFSSGSSDCKPEAWVFFSPDAGTSVRISARLESSTSGDVIAGGEGTVPLVEGSPNGPQCEPTCKHGTLTVTLDGGAP